jgi:amino acid permease
MQERRKFYEAISVLIGTIIGAGIFAIPYVVMKAGILVGIFYFLFLGLIVLTIHLTYGEIVLRTSGAHRIVGYGEIYLGQSGKKILFISALVSLFGSNLTYLILGGNFLRIMFNGQARPELFYILIFWILMSLGIFLDWKRMTFLEFFMTGLLLVVIVAIAVYGLSHLQLKNFQLINFSYFFLPWGVIFYALSGGSAISELKEILGDNKKYLKKVIIAGTIVPVIVYFIFTISVIGATGTKTTEEAINGLKDLFGKEIIYLAAFFGLLAVATSYLVLGIVIKKIFILDLKINRIISNSTVCLVPLILYLAGIHNFILVISFLGLWLGAVDGILMLLMHHRAKKMGDRQPEYSLTIPKFVYYLLGAIFILGPVLSFIFAQY